MAEADEMDPWRPPSRRSRQPQPRQMPLWQELPILLIVAFCLAVLIRTFLLQAFFIPSGSMENTLLIGDRVLVNKVVYDMRDPERGEVVVFRGTDAWAPEFSDDQNLSFGDKLGRTVGDLVGVARPGEKDFIKRVIGLPGDRVACCDEQGRVTVNGVSLDETYILEDSPLEVPPNPSECRSRRFSEVVIPPGQIFVLGDHRLVSQDARCQGPVPIDNVIGRAFIIVWPSVRWTSLPVPSTFEALDGSVVPPTAPVSGGGPGASDDPEPTPTPTNPDTSGGIALVGPILSVLAITVRSRHLRSARHRRLHP